MRKTADRIQARAIERAGELLKAIKAQPGVRRPTRIATTRSKAAREAGLSKDQQARAIQLASIPKTEFERLVESDDPPSVTELAKRGIRSRAATTGRQGDHEPAGAPPAGPGGPPGHRPAGPTAIRRCDFAILGSPKGPGRAELGA